MAADDMKTIKTLQAKITGVTLAQVKPRIFELESEDSAECTVDIIRAMFCEKCLPF